MAGERTEAPTARRRSRARREGDHPVSGVLVSLGGLSVAALLLPSALELLVQRSRALLVQSLQPGTAAGDLSSAGLSLVALVALVLGPAALAALVLGFWQTGAGLSLTPLGWDPQRLDPIANVGRVWSRGTLFALLRWLVTGTLLGVLGFRLFVSEGPALAASVGSVQGAARLVGELCRKLLWCTLGLVALGAVLDVLVVRSAWLARLRMTRQEVQREQRENEGDVGLRQARQRAHRELSRSAELGELPGATLLVLGRPRLASALVYDADHDRAPRILMQASGRLAQTLEALAPAHGVPVHEDQELALALSALNPEDPIPKELFASVASALRSARSG